LCKHKDKCNEVLTILRGEDYVQMCEKGAAEYALAILAELDIVDGSNYSGWTEAQEKIMVDYLKEHGVQYGGYAKIAKLTGKTTAQVKSKAKRLRQKGVI
jgi:hypothetical protein